MTAAPDAGLSGRHPTIALVGVAAGFLSGLFGVGGGILIVPGLVLVARFPQRLAHGTSLAAVVPIAISSTASFWLHGNIDWPAAMFLAAGAVGGAVAGTRLLHVLPHRTLGFAFAGVLLASAVRLFVAADAAGRGAITPWTAVALVLAGVVTGVLAGLLGVGGGTVMVPAMVLLFGIPAVVAKGTSLAVIVPTAVMGTWRNRSRGNADLRAAAILGVAGVASAFLGGYVSDRMTESVSNTLFSLLLTVVAVRLVVQLEREKRREAQGEGTVP